ncbi:hypothetical protein RHODO2019_07670 [Rhodococcus antarcticus]|jgi:ABC-type transport system substrate-binding protein|uniref:DUF732 domain-containing protein n=1 Tax=Rhodococcus antarcticus TaxID=2987751 RepID=A0ABY6P3N3_9NOCA|nr:hypothetical protein [Rhodococcus antarcticus]UZJ26272.1 hypothetical protein RHODO2019_07670 [Rhodococcus antarcticus]
MRTRGTILAALLMTGVLAGCSGQAGESAAPATKTTTTTAAPTTTVPRPTTTVPTTTPPSPAVTTTAAPAAPVATIPRPGAQQADNLYAGLVRIEPLFAKKSRDTLVSRSRDQCTSILQGLPDEKLIDNAISRFTAPGLDGITRQQAFEVNDLIRSGGWCV